MPHSGLVAYAQGECEEGGKSQAGRQEDFYNKENHPLAKLLFNFLLHVILSEFHIRKIICSEEKLYVVKNNYM